MTADLYQIAELHGNAKEREDIIVVGFTQVARRARDYGVYLDDLSITSGADSGSASVQRPSPQRAATPAAFGPKAET